MSRHAAPRPPKAHWLLLVFGGLVLLAELFLNGAVTNAHGEAMSRPGPTGGTDAAGAQVRSMAGAGPVLRVAADGTVQRAAMPAGTVALTFDDGPDPRWTPQILDALRAQHAHATFFVIGSKVNQYPDLVRRIVAEGHEVGVHTFTHTELAVAPAWRRRLELSLTQNAIAAATGRTTRLMRPPYSSTPDALTTADFAALRTVAAEGYLAVLTDRDTGDWRRPGVEAIVAAAGPRTDGGAMVMFHDGGGDRSQTVAAVQRLLAGPAGVRFITVSAGLGLAPPPTASFSVTARGLALRWSQTAAAWIDGWMWWLLVLGSGLAVLRLLVQLPAAGLHARRQRRTAPRLGYLGPVTVIVPAFNEAANIAATVRSLLANDYPALDVIVVDDGSTDATSAVVRGLGLPGVRLIRQANAGKPAALNTGIAAARGDLLVLVDGDTVFAPDAVGQLVQPFEDPKIGASSGNTKVANRRGLLGRWQHLEYVVGFNLDRRMFDLGRCMPTIPGAIGAFRRSALADAGGVPADTLAEDTDLTMAVLRAGWRVVYADRAIAWTEAPASMRQLWRQRYRWCYGTMQAMWKHRRALLERGGAGRLGRRGLVYLLLFQVLLPLCAPLVDVYAIYGLCVLPPAQVAGVWCGFTALQVLTTAFALRLDREPWAPLWSVPLQQIVYRQLLYLVTVQSAVAALLGGRQRWQAMARAGLADPMRHTTAGQPAPAVRR
ncbi:glycosyltransferase [Dactylosporangium vinaceum]|uniref:Bifunctional polysaccharide deacetylase/glycosyltransferase family 2 protein n=1 Tax=Dactylosporangium vinaceum TaxID=53362 RepID=A0ABV5MK81_9ACTN|nr:bifunctional polysaccharide deacetylase/glycosyltransferase family 2 protein [Dactylosporangium vinaceum]UAB99658.1 glycosyltransferase [Dactylosporangium vinaceum]